MKKDTFKALRDKVINIRESNYVDEIVSIIVEKLMKQLPNIKNSNEVYSLEYSFSEYDKKDIIEACKLIEIITKRLLEKLEDDRDLHKVYSLELSFTNYNKKDIRAACEIVEKKIPGIFLLHISGSSEYGTYSCVNYKFTPFTFFERWLGC